MKKVDLELNIKITVSIHADEDANFDKIESDLIKQGFAFKLKELKTDRADLMDFKVETVEMLVVDSR